MIQDLLWFYGFQVFYSLKHPLYAPFKILHKAFFFGSKKERIAMGDSVVAPVVPRKIWIYWAQGFADAPMVIKLCRDSWVRHNPGWEVIQLSDANVQEYIQFPYSLEGKDVPYAAYSDIIRMQLLAKYGGVWADATTFCSAPLDTWLPSVMQSGFFAFQKPKTTLASWFLAVEQGNALVRKWDEYVMRYWKYAYKPARYFWLHYLFEYLIVRDHVARRIWQSTPQVSSAGPYAARRCLKENADQKLCIDHLFDRAVFVHKLDWKMGISDDFVQDARDRMIRQH